MCGTDRLKAVVVGSILVSVTGLVIFFADGFRCLGGDCTAEWWIWTLMLGPVPVAAVAAAWLWARNG